MKKRRTFFSLTLIMFVLFSCTDNPLDVKIDHIGVTVDYVNVDSMYRDAGLQEVEIRHEKLQQELDFLYLYELGQNVRKFPDSVLPEDIRNFYQSEYIQRLEEAKKSLFASLNPSKNKLTQGFRYLRFHFPDSPVPYHIFYINKLFSPVHCSDSSISVGLENYLNPDHPIIKEIPSNKLFEWQKESMQFEFLERDVLLQWIQAHLFEENDGNLAQHIVQAGKLLYVLNATLPNEEERIILRYGHQDLIWAEKNEKQVWDYLVKEQLLFQNNDRDKANFLNAGPKTVGLPDEAPDRLGQFLGYKMVKGYMTKNKEVSLQELLKTEYNRILQTYEID
ncbi:MAG: hypothetical protein R3277_09370 [Brumimicrobium sp.]|nr:hypothetical protein [Brumimicrobium sp.]